MSPGWHCNSLQIASNVENRIAFALLFFKIDKFELVISTLSDSSLRDIFLFAIITSKFTTINLIPPIWSNHFRLEFP